MTREESIKEYYFRRSIDYIKGNLEKNLSLESISEIPMADRFIKVALNLPGLKTGRFFIAGGEMRVRNLWHPR